MKFLAALVVVGVTGFISLSYEIVWYRAYAFVSRGSPAAFGVLLGAYLAGLALGSLTSRRFCGHGRAGRDDALPFVVRFLFAANVVGFLVTPALSWICTWGPWGLSLALVALAAGMLGAILPLVAHVAILPDERAGKHLSYLYVSNIVGSAAGSLLTGFVLMDVLPVRSIAALLFVVGVVITAILSWAVDLGAAASDRTEAEVASRLRTSRLFRAAAALTTILVLTSGAWLHDGLWERMLFKRDYDGETRFQRVLENRHGVIAITEDETVYGGGAYDGRITTDLVDDRNWIVRPYALGAFDVPRREVLMIGLSMGPWAQVVAHLPGVEKLTVVEINPGYLELIRHYDEVRGLLANPKIEIVVDDGRRWLLRHPDRRFDLIVQNTTWHWRAHISSLLSREYLTLCREHLEPSGAMLFNTTFSEEAMATALDVFPHGIRIFNNMLVGNRPLTFDRERWRTALTSWAIDGRLVFDPQDPRHRERLEGLLALGDRIGGDGNESLEPADELRERLRETEVITDDNMLSEWKKLHW